MNWKPIEQRTKEWFDYKVAKIGGTSFGQAISTRENGLLYELLNQKFDGYIMPSDYENEDMLFGTEQEPIGIDKYEIKSGIKFKRGGIIISDFYPGISMASPDGVNDDDPNYCIIVECKATRSGAKQIQRHEKGPESSMIPQIINYFVQSDTIREVRWFSFCPFRPERELVERIYTPSDFKTEIIKGRYAIKEIEQKLIKLEQSFIF